MTLVPHTVAVTALVCALTAAADARDLFILEAQGGGIVPATVRDSGHDLEELLDDFLLQQGVFSGLGGPTSATLDYLGIPNAIRMQASASGAQVVLQIPSIGFSSRPTKAAYS